MRDFKKLLRKIPKIYKERYQRYTKKDTKDIQRKIPKIYKEYHYPTIVCSLFVMPDGKMYGVSKQEKHFPMMEEMLCRKIDEDEFLPLIAKSKICRIIVNSNPDLYIDSLHDPSREQVKTLKDLVRYGKYKHIEVGTSLFHT